MSELFDHALKQKYNKMKINYPPFFLKDAVNWDSFTPLLKGLYHNDIDSGSRSNIPVKTMIKVLFLRNVFNMTDQHAETLIKDRIFFKNFLDHHNQYRDARTIWLFRERLSRTGRDCTVWKELQIQLESMNIKGEIGSEHDATFIISDPSREIYEE